MPWSKVHDHSDCPSDEPWAVVKDDDGSVAGCHATEEEADEQLAALYASESEHSTVVVVLKPVDAQSLAVEDGDDPDDLHLTLGYYGEESELDESTFDALKTWVAERTNEAIVGHVSGVARLGDDDPRATVLLIESAEIKSLRESLEAAAPMVETYPHFIPHLTLGYGVDEPSDPPAEVSFSEVELWIGGVPYGREGNDHALVAASEEYDEYELYSKGYWRGVLAVEGIETGDGRMFEPGSLDWRDLPLPMMWQERTAEGHDESFVVGKILTIERNQDNEILGTGRYDMGGEKGREAHRLRYQGMIRGLSVSLDDVKDNDIEMIWPEDSESDEDALLVQPERIIFHHGRIMDVNFTGNPAMQEAYLELVPDAEVDGPGEDEDSDENEDEIVLASGKVFRVVPSHSTATVDGPWDGGEQEIRLNSPMTLAQANGSYAWIDESAIDDDGLIPRSFCRYIHHEVSTDGTPGAANLTACSSAIGVLNGARGGSTIPAGDRRGVYNHLAKHISDAGREPPELLTIQEVELRTARRQLAAAVGPVNPPSSWFRNPRFQELTPWTIEPSLQVYGHLAQKGTCHTGVSGTCVTPPHEDDYGYFTTGEILCDDGTRVPVGQITLGTGHAPTPFGVRPAVEHYDNTGYVAADVAIGTDKFGIWVAGAARPDLTPGQLRAARAASISGDWRSISSRLRLIGALLVNVPGFPIPRTRTYAHDGEQLALVAAGVVASPPPEISRGVIERIAKSIGRDAESRAAELHARVHPSQM